MIRLKHIRACLAPAVLALALLCATAAHGQYNVTGTTAGGGNIVIGNGTSLGSLISGDGNLSFGGFDDLTFSAGSFAIGSGVDTVTFTTSNNTVTVDGTVGADTGLNAFTFSGTNETVTVGASGVVQGGAGAPDTGGGGGPGGVGLYFYSTGGDVDGISITNHGLIGGGAGGDSNNNLIGPGMPAISVIAQSSANTSIDHFTLVNSGSIIGGMAGTGNSGFYRNGDGFGVNLNANGGIANVSLENSGLIMGGDGGDFNFEAFGSAGAEAVYLYANTADITGVSITNSGTIHGGDAGNALSSFSYFANDGANGIFLLANGGAIGNIALGNSGLITGGTGGASGSGLDSGNGANAFFLSASTAINLVSITNSGTVLGGSGGSGSSQGSGGAGGNAIFLDAGSDVGGVTVSNSGLIEGGAGAPGGNASANGNGGNGFEIQAGGNITAIILNNTGSIAGGNSSFGYSTYTAEGNGGAGVYFTATGSLGNVMIANSNAITGGDGASQGYGFTAGSGGNAIDLEGYNGIGGITIQNSGNIIAGAGGGSMLDAGNSSSGNGGSGIYIYALGGNIAGTQIVNSGNITGGAGGSTISSFVDPGNGGAGLEIYGGLYMYDNSVTNAVSGRIVGGNAGNNGPGLFANGAAGGFGIYVQTQSNDIFGLALNNAGLIRGGNGGIGDEEEGYSGGPGGQGVFIDADRNLFYVVINNTGPISGGQGGNRAPGGAAIYLGAYVGDINGVTISTSGNLLGGTGGSSATNEGGSGGDAMQVATNTGNIYNLVIANSGNMIGGNGGNTTQAGYDGGNGGYGLDIFAENNMSGVSVVNTGLIQGGNGGASADAVSYGYDGVHIGSDDTLSNLSVVNYGTMQGGGGFYGGAGIYIDADANANPGIAVTNYGRMTGGAGVNGGNAGVGVVFYTDGAVLNNWGAISTGAGADQKAIYISGFNNTVNLNGHSTVNGLISGIGSGQGNVLSLNFTGLTPAAISALKAQIGAQGNLSNFVGTFTVRGVTYTVDPMAIQFNLSSYQLQALTPNQAAIGVSLDSITYNPSPGSPLFDLFNAIDQSGNVPGALEQLSPQVYEVYGYLAIVNANFLAQSVDARLDNVSLGSESIQASGIGTQAEVGGTPDNSVAGWTKDGDGKESKTIAPPEPTPDRWGFFATGDGLFFRGNPHDVDAQDGKADTAGTIVGVDGKAGDHGVIGALFAYNNSAVTMDSFNDHATVESYTGGIYGSFKDEGFYLNGLAAYTRNNYNSTRNILLSGLGTTADGSTNADQATVNLDGGYDWNATNRLSIGPMAGVQYVYLGVDGFNENGAGPADLAVGSENVNSLQSRVGFRTNYHLATSQTSTFAAEFHAAWQHEYLDDSRAIGASFEGTGLAPFAVQTASPLRDAAVVGLGVNFTFHDRLTLFAEYELELWSASYFEQTINGGARISF